MNIKKLLFFTLLLRTFSAEMALSAQQPANDGSWLTAAGTALIGLASAASHATTAYSNIQNGKQLEINTEIAQITEKDRHQKHIDDGRQAIISTNSSILTGLKEAQSIYKSDSTPEGKKELAEINRTILNLSKFMREGKNDKEIFNAADYPTEAPKIPSESEIKKPEPKPNGMFKQAALFMAAAPLFAADKIADALYINSTLALLAQSKAFNGGLLDTHQKGIGQATALIIAAGTLGALYKAYKWYTNEDRLLAQETVVELEAKQKEIAAQFKKEIQKATLSAEEKAKLIKAYENYMDELQDEIDEQKIVAGHGVAKKVAIGLVAAAGGVTGLHALAQYYLNKPTDMPKDETTENHNSSEQQNLTNSTPTEPQQPGQSDTSSSEQIVVMPDAQQPQTEDPETAYKSLTRCEKILPAWLHDKKFGTSPEKRKEINSIIAAKNAREKQLEKEKKQLKKEKDFEREKAIHDKYGYYSVAEDEYYAEHKRHSWEDEIRQPNKSAITANTDENQNSSEAVKTEDKQSDPVVDTTANTTIKPQQDNTIPTTTTENQNPTEPVKTEDQIELQQNTSAIEPLTPTNPELHVEETYDPTEYNSLTPFQQNMRWPTTVYYYGLNSLPGSEWDRIDRINAEHDAWMRKEEAKKVAQ